MTNSYEHLGDLPTKLVNSPPDYDLYAALSSLVNVEYININLEWDASHEIPDYAFRVIDGKQSCLKSIIFNGQFSISRIGNYAFYPIANLSKILMSSIPIGFISAHAFDFEDSFNNNLTINLFNTSLTEDSFEAGVFTNSKRPLNLYLGLNKIRYIERKVFEKLFKTNDINSLHLWDNPLNCDHYKPFEWLLQQKSALKNRLKFATCSNGTDFWDLKLLPNDNDNNWLEELSNKTIEDANDALESVKSIRKITENRDSFSLSEELKKLMSYIRRIYKFVEKSKAEIELSVASNITTNCLTIFSHMINQNNAWNNASSGDKTEMASQILLYIHYTAFLLSCSIDDVKQTEEILDDNMFVKTFHLNSSQDLLFKSNNTSIHIPREINSNENEECNNSAFGAIIKELGTYLSEDLSNELKINSDILAFSISNSNETFLIQNDTKVKMSLEHNYRLMFGDEITCVYWDFQTNKWSSNGCNIVPEDSNRDITVCECNHLTNFAALLDVSGRENESLAKSILTYVSCGLSIICLFLTILVTSMRRAQNTVYNLSTNELIKTRNIITYNLCVCLIISDLLILFGMDRTEHDWLCETFSGMLLYSLLCSFTWMLIEGYNLYRTTSQVFNVINKRLRLIMIGYGMPCTICLVALTIIWLSENIFFDALRGEYFCWVSSEKHPNHIWIFVGPALSAILFNAIIMFLLFREILGFNQRNERYAKHVSKLKQIFSFTSLIFNLGLTWILFILYIHRFGIFYTYFSYVFIILNGSQGVFIFIYHLALFINQNSKKFKTSNNNFELQRY